MSCRRRVFGPRRHRCSRWHAELVDGYRAAVAAQESRAESWSLGYSTELSEFYRDVEPRVTFRAWLEGHREDRTEWEIAA